MLRWLFSAIDRIGSPPYATAMPERDHSCSLPRISFAGLLAAFGLVLVMGLGLFSTDAFAGRRPFIWVWDTEVLHEREVELEQWIWEMRTDDFHAAWLWWAPIFGLTDNLELAIPLEGYSWWGRKVGDPEQWETGTRIALYGLSLRWRLAPNDPEEAGALVPLLRVAIKRQAVQQLRWQFEANAVLSYDLPKLHGALDLGGFAWLGATTEAWLTYAGGLAWGEQNGLRLGGEVFGEVALTEGRKSFTMAGPDIGWTHGRAWLTLGCLFGVTEHAARWMPRLIWAIKL